MPQESYQKIGTQELATTITYGNWNTAAYNDWTLIDVGGDDFETNDDGDYVKQGGITKLGTRNANYDVAEELDPGNHAPPNWADRQEGYVRGASADTGDTTSDPKLVVTYTTGGIGIPLVDHHRRTMVQ